MNIHIVRPYPGQRWVSIVRYAASVEQMARSSGHPVAVAQSPWWNPPSVARGIARRHWRQPAFGAGRGDIVHFTDQALAHHVGRVERAATVVTCHDWMPFALQGFYRTGFERRLKQAFLRHSRRGLERADLVIAVSGAASVHAREAGVAPERLAIVPVALNDEFMGDSPGLAAPALPARPRILSVGHCKEYKNLDLLLESVAATPRLGTAAIVRVGERLPRRLRDKAASLGLGDRIVELGYMGGAPLRAVFDACDVLAQPSRYEGFGMPVAEAMAAGLPVVSTDGGGLLETVGAGGLIVPLEDHLLESTAADARRFGEALQQVLDDPQTAEDLRRRGKLRAEALTAESVAPTLLAAYQAALELRERR
ncbi:MAG: glycosyltransferase family 4 protein [Dehalococcoidia bacterium]